MASTKEATAIQESGEVEDGDLKSTADQSASGVTSSDDQKRHLARRRESDRRPNSFGQGPLMSGRATARGGKAFASAGMTLQLFSKQQLTEEYCAYTPLLLRKELPATRASAKKHKIPRSHESLGTTLFLDISGFTKLGEKLREQLGAAEGAAALADTINKALTAMVEFVYEFGGDVLKFAGDALICLFEGEDADETLLKAKTCSVKLLKFFAEAQQSGEAGLSEIHIHGGMAEGYLKCMHLGTEEVLPGNWLVCIKVVLSSIASLLIPFSFTLQHVHGHRTRLKNRRQDDGRSKEGRDLCNWNAYTNHGQYCFTRD